MELGTFAGLAVSALLIFAGGLLVGLAITSERVDQLQNTIQQLYQDKFNYLITPKTYKEG